MTAEGQCRQSPMMFCIGKRFSMQGNKYNCRRKMQLLMWQIIGMTFVTIDQT